jgi:hypothetical protein
MKSSGNQVPNTDFASRLQTERIKLAVAAKGGIAAPLAGAIYWFALFILGVYVSNYAWCLIAFITSGLIFPLALLLQKPTKSNLMVKSNALSGVVFASLINIALGWSITIAAFYTNLGLVPLALAINLSLHFGGLGWIFGSKAIMVHPVVRAAVVTALWYTLPESRFTAIPLAVSLIYLVTIPLVLREVAAAEKQLGVN